MPWTKADRAASRRPWPCGPSCAAMVVAAPIPSPAVWAIYGGARSAVWAGWPRRAGREDAAEHGHAQRPADLAGVSFMAEPTPALASGSEPMIDSVAEAMVKPMPVPSRASVAATRP